MIAVDTPKVIRDRVWADISARLDSETPPLAVGLLNILSWIIAGVAFSIYSTIAWTARKSLPDSDDPEVVAGWGSAFEIPRLDPVAAAGGVSFTGTNGSIAAAGSILVAESGQQYTLDADVEIAAGVGSGNVTAIDAGAAGNVAAGQQLTLLVPIAGIGASVTVGVDGIAGGADQESIAAWDARILERLRAPPQGGSEADYIFWARSAHPSVTNVWVSDNGYGTGTVVVRFMTYGATSNGIPAPQVVDAVFDYIDARRQVGMAALFVVAPEPVAVDLTLDNVTPDTLAVRSAIEAEINALIVREATPGGTIPLTHFDEAASLAEGEEDHHFVAGTTIPVCAPGQILVPGTITWS